LDVVGFVSAHFWRGRSVKPLLQTPAVRSVPQVAITSRLVEGCFLARDNRFQVTVEVGGRKVGAHLPNSGRLGELLPGRRVFLV